MAENALTRLEAARNFADKRAAHLHVGKNAEYFPALVSVRDCARILAVLRAAVEWLREGAPDDEYGPDIRLSAAVDSMLSEGE